MIFAVNCTVMWACCNVYCGSTSCHKSCWKSNFLGTKSSTAFSLHWWMTSHVFIKKNALLTVSVIIWHLSCNTCVLLVALPVPVPEYWYNFDWWQWLFIKVTVHTVTVNDLTNLVYGIQGIKSMTYTDTGKNTNSFGNFFKQSCRLHIWWNIASV